MKIESLVGQSLYALRDMTHARVAEVLLEELVASKKITRPEAVKLIGKIDSQLRSLFDGAMTDIQKSINQLEE